MSNLEPPLFQPNDPAGRAFSVLERAFKTGADTVQGAHALTIGALDKAYLHNGVLVEKVLQLTELATTSAKQSVEMVKIQSAKDLEMAKLQNDDAFWQRVETMANGPMGQMVLAKLGVMPGLDEKQRKAVAKVIGAFFGEPEACSRVQATDPDSYAIFLKWTEGLE